MKKPRKAILTLAAVTALFSAGGCDLNSNVAVYGPPPDDYQTTRQTVTQTYPQSTTEFDPAQNIPEEVYGPPADFGETVELTAEDTFEPEHNIAEPVYGPPADLGYSMGSGESAETTETSDTAETDDTIDTAEV